MQEFLAGKIRAYINSDWTKVDRDDLIEISGELNIDTKHSESNSAIVTKIRSVIEHNPELLEPPKKERAAVRALGTSYKDNPYAFRAINLIIDGAGRWEGRRKKVILNAQQDDAPYEQFMVNGYAVTIPYGIEYDAPMPIVYNIRTRTFPRPRQIHDDAGRLIGTEIENRRRYSMQEFEYAPGTEGLPDSLEQLLIAMYEKDRLADLTDREVRAFLVRGYNQDVARGETTDQLRERLTEVILKSYEAAA